MRSQFPKTWTLASRLDQTRRSRSIKESSQRAPDALALGDFVVYIFLQGWRCHLDGPWLAVPVSRADICTFPVCGSPSTRSLPTHPTPIPAVCLVLQLARLHHHRRVEGVERHIARGMTGPKERGVKQWVRRPAPFVGIGTGSVGGFS